MNVKLTDKDKIRIDDPDDIYAIMQRILLREDKIDRDKEHFWVIGMDQAAFILYIELVNFGSVRLSQIDPQSVFRVAVLKNAARIVLVRNYPAGVLKPSEDDKDATDRLIQVGRILDVPVQDHLIISTTNYMTFKATGLMVMLEKSIKYVPPYQLEKRIREEEKKLARVALDELQTLNESEQKRREEAEKQLSSAVLMLLDKGVDAGQISDMLNLPLIDIAMIIQKNKNKMTEE